MTYLTCLNKLNEVYLHQITIKTNYVMRCKNRTAKIHAKGVPRTCEWKTVPWLNLSGVWLEKAGFEVGDNITISVSRNAITIKVAQKAPKPSAPESEWDL